MTVADTCPPRPPSKPDFALYGPNSISSGQRLGCASWNYSCYEYSWEVRDLVNVAYCEIWMPGVFDRFTGYKAYFYTYYQATTTLYVECYSPQGESTVKSYEIRAY